MGFSANDTSVNTLTNVTIKDSYLEGGQNGIHIKTHNDGGQGLISDVTYSNITFNGEFLKIQKPYIVAQYKIQDLNILGFKYNKTTLEVRW